MIRLLTELYRRADLLQRRRPVKIAALVLVLLACGLSFGSLVGTSASLDRQRTRLIETLTGKSVQAGDPEAVTLLEEGLVTVDGVTYGGPAVAERPELIFDDQGVVEYPEGLAEVLLREKYPDWAPRWLLEQPGTTWLLGTVTTGLLVLAVLTSLTVPLLLTLAGVLVANVPARLLGGDELGFAVTGVGMLVFASMLLSRVALIALDRPNQICAIAHTVVKETARTGLPLVFVVAILVIIPLLPAGLDPESPLRYRIQTFISRGIGLTYYLAACMTLFLACATVAFEIRDRQIWQLVTKPVARASYVMGKWVGLIVVNAIILSVSSMAIFTYVQYLRQQPVAQGVAGQEDAQQIRDAVLTARVGLIPDYPKLDREQLSARVLQVINNDPELSMMEEVPLETRREIATQVLDEYSMAQRSVLPNLESGREMTFTGLGEARGGDSMLTLRYRFHILRSDEHETFPVLFVFNRNPSTALRQTYVPTMSHVLSIPPSMVQEDGTLTVEVRNIFTGLASYTGGRGTGALNWEVDDFELLYEVSTFEANFARAMLVHWVKLAFLAMLGIACGSFLGFPTACLMAFTVFIAGTLGPFLAQSLAYYGPPRADQIDWGDAGMAINWIFQTTIKGIAGGVVFLLESFGRVRPTQLLVEGRLLSWGMVGSTLMRIGVLWTGLALLIGWLTMRSRQLAIYSGHG